jgi:glycosyltransferase involved in cell wall biosynthesis
MPQRPRVLVLTPIAPAPTGNGLAMRMWSLTRAALRVADVVLVVVPIAGESGFPTPDCTGLTVLDDLSTSEGRSVPAAVDWLRKPTWRRWFEHASPLHPLVQRVSPNTAAEIVARLAHTTVDGVIVGRLGLSLLGCAIAEQLGCGLFIDSDDDDVSLHHERGEHEIAAAAGRVAELTFPMAAVVTGASNDVVARLTARYGISAERWPNCVALPDSYVQPPGSGRILFLANFTYPPNVEGAVWLVHDVLPQLPPRYQITLAGACGTEVSRLAGPRVRVTGAVAEVGPLYADADVVAVPLLTGSGSRIKVLEAFAHRRAVVSTPKGAEGIEVDPGVHFLSATSAPEFATALEAATEQPAAAPRVSAAFDYVRERYSDEVVARIGADLITRSLLAMQSPSSSYDNRHGRKT